MSEKAPPYGETREPKPLTDDELDTLESGLRELATEPESANVSAQLALRLVAEVRRLRAEEGAFGKFFLEAASAIRLTARLLREAGMAGEDVLAAEEKALSFERFARDLQSSRE